MTSLKQLLCCLPMVQVPESMSYDKVFRVLLIQFMDAQNFDVRSVKKSCIHIVHPDGRIIPSTPSIVLPRRQGTVTRKIKAELEPTLHE